VRDNNADPAGDPAVPATVYYYDGNANLYTTTDSGATWQVTYNGFPDWNVPIFGIAVPPRGTAAAGDIWAFAGWKLYRSVDGGHTFSNVWQFYSVQSAVAVGPLPNVTSRRTGRTAADMSALCAQRLPADQRPRPAHAALLRSDEASGYAYPFSTSASAAYVVYGAGQAAYGSYGVFASVDYGNSWLELTTPSQALGDDPNVLQPSLSAPGTVFVGTEGRGGFYADVTQVLLQALESCE